MGATGLGTTWLIGPNLPAWQRQRIRDLQARCPRDRDLIWILSSGTQAVNQIKAIGLSREALEVSARAVNAHLEVSSKDRWLIAIPTYHIGGYAITVRARLSRSRTFTLNKWSAKAFSSALEANKITLTSVVPTQLHDLVAVRCKPPSALRAVVVGGGALSEDLYSRARSLGWPVLPSYGLTECASQVATASLESLKRSGYPGLQVLNHARLELRDGQIWIQSRALCELIATLKVNGEFTLENPRRSEGLPTQDLGEWRDGLFWPMGRADETVKISGVLVSLLQVEHELRASARALPGRLTVLCWPEARRGGELVAVTDSKGSLQEFEKCIQLYNREAQGPWRIQKFCWVPELPVTDLGKIKRAELRNYLGWP